MLWLRCIQITLQNSRRLKALFKFAISVTEICLLAGSSALAQRPKRPVSVSRSASLRVTIARGSTTVFDYFTDSAKLTQWFPDQAIFEPQIGGKYHFVWKNTEGVWSGVVTEFIRGNTLAFTWRAPSESLETQVRIKLMPQDTGVVVELTHSGFNSVLSLDKAIEAWSFYLENLKSLIETGTDLRQKAAPRQSGTPTKTRRRAG